MAKASDETPAGIRTFPSPGSWRRNFCLECGGYIHSFASNEPVLKDLADYRDVFRDRTRGPVRALHGKIRHFRITRYNFQNDGPPVVFINGFLQQATSDVRDWTTPLSRFFANSPWYHLDWESKKLHKIFRSLGKSIAGGSTGVGNFSAPKQATSVGAMFLPEVVVAAVRNPWHNAMGKAEIVGVLLADLIVQSEQKGFILIGHSLGARVIFFALRALAIRRKKSVLNAYLLGGAVGNSPPTDWEFVAQAVSGSIHNFHSSKDGVLELLYQNFNARLSNPIGLKPINSPSSRVVDHDFSEVVGGHLQWKACLPQVFSHIATHGRGL